MSKNYTDHPTTKLPDRGEYLDHVEEGLRILREYDKRWERRVSSGFDPEYLEKMKKELA